MVAYWDLGSCGPEGDDLNWMVCENMRFNCPDIIHLDSCPSGRAFKYNVYGDGSRGSYIANGCTFFYWTEYVCEKLSPSISSPNKFYKEN